MPKEQIEKTIIILDENEVNQVMRFARERKMNPNQDNKVVYLFLREMIVKKVEAALRKRCG